jgi:hypothetical protein
LDFEAIVYPAPKGRLYSEHPDPAPDDIIPEHYCTCNKEIPCPVHDRNYQKIKELEHYAPILSSRKIDMDCPVHGTVEHVLTGQQMKETFDPEPPLHARVAKELGYYIHREGATGNWFMGDARSGDELPPIPPYDKDRDLAIGALEEYCDKKGLTYHIRRNRAGDYNVILYPPDKWDDDSKWYYHMTLARATCEAICAHAEGK